jgi:hypothetical protein
MRRRIGDLELDDDPARVDVEAVHRFLSEDALELVPLRAGP